MARFTLENFNLDYILKSGLKLLSSDTQKYEIKDSELNSLNNNGNKQHVISGNEKKNTNSNEATQSIKEQRKLLNSKLDIDLGGAANLDTTHFFSDEDLLANNHQQHDTNNIVILKLKRKLSEDFEIKPNFDIKKSVEEIILANDPSSCKKIKTEPDKEISETDNSDLIASIYLH